MEKNHKFFRITNEFTDCALPLTSDVCNRCGFRCAYCFSSLFHFWNPQTRYKKIPIKLANPERIIKIFLGKYPNNPYYKHFIKKRFILHIGSLSEPFDPLETKFGVGKILYDFLADIKYPVLFSTKGISLFLDSYKKIFKKASKYKNFAFQISITTNNDDIAKDIEKGVPSTTERLRAMKILSDMGFLTILRLRPFIVGITDDGLEDLLEKAKKCGAYAVSTEFFCIDKRALDLPDLKIFNKYMGCDLIAFYRKMSPTTRGTYMRLNRNIKRYFVERMIKKCRELDLKLAISGPDFKELGYDEGGNCCGLPSKNPFNKELENFCKKQMTSVLIKAHKKFWENGGKKEVLIKWDDMKDEKYGDWMKEHRYWTDSIVCYQSDYERLYTGHEREFLEVWNSLSTPRNPYRYFDGIMKPVGLDEKGNIIYKYNPPKFYYKWHKEGLI